MKTYSELLARKDAPPGSSWGLFGPDDDMGTVNFLTPERTVAARDCIRRGASFNLDCALQTFDPPTSHYRECVQHHIMSGHPNHRDDWLDSFYLQSGTQIDGLRHVRHAVHGFYNGTPDDSVRVGSARLGVGRWADHGMAGRGLLLDVERYLKERGQSLDHRNSEPIDVALLDAVAKAQNVRPRPGDILMLRTGWLRFYLEELTPEDRRDQSNAIHSAGLLQSRDTLAWLWDHQIAVCAADNPGLECIPPQPSSPFAAEVAGLPEIPSEFWARLMHPQMIAMLGLVIGELWNLEALSADCAQDGVWESFVCIKPLNLIGGVGSPANAVAIK